MPPMRRPTFFILTALAEAPRHGYGIIRRVDALSDGGVRLGPGTMYGALDRLAEQELVALDREEVEGGRLRRYYRLTPPGRAALAAEVRRLEQDSRVGQSALGGAT
jgi:PadR family transcriptional regulator, regulatory protein PadR